MKKDLVIALAGNPNSGKTSIFNALTGSRQHVGNWPGVTVEKKEGTLKYNGREITIVDLPGTYSLGAYSEDEIVARNFILEEKPDIIINVVDATNIERNLYLTTQLMEISTNIVVALNMIDEVKNKNMKINSEKLSQELGISVVETSATKNIGIKNLIEKAINLGDKKLDKSFFVDYGSVALKGIEEVKEIIARKNILVDYNPYWLAVKLLEEDQYIADKVKKYGDKDIFDYIKRERDIITEKEGYEPEALFVDKRYDFISKAVSKTVKRSNTKEASVSDKIDKVVTHKWLGIPIFALIMFFVYQITMSFGNEFLGDGLLGGAFEGLGEKVGEAMANSPELLRSFVVDGIIGGLGAIVPFIPLILVLYFLISLLEDSGYMARAAYVMDRFMSSIGLHGKTAVSLIIGSGCNVAGIMSTRTLESKKDRMTAILINPFISCSAKIEVYALFTAAFFAGKKVGIFSASGFIVFCLYILGIAIAIISGKIFSSTLFKDESSYFVMELPPYRIPTLKSVLIHMWEKVSAFVKKAGTIIFAIVILVWVLSNLPAGVEPGTRNSVLGMIGSVFAPIFKPAGFGNWQAAVALVTGVGAKEAVIATMGTVYSVAEGAELTTAIQSVFTPLSAISYMVFVLLYAPCAAAIGAIRRETNSHKWAWFSVIYTTGVAYIVSVLVFQIGKLLGFN